MVGEDCSLIDASYVRELGILSLFLADSEGCRAMNIDVATGRQTDKYGDYFIYPFKDGRTLIGAVDKDVEVIEAYGYMDTSGKPVQEPVYYDASCFFDGYAAVSKYTADEGAKFGYIDSDGNVAYPFELKYADIFSDGAAIVQTEDG